LQKKSFHKKFLQKNIPDPKIIKQIKYVFIKSKPNIKENEIQTPNSNYLLLMFACMRRRFSDLDFLCGFYKGDGGDSLYGDDVSKDCLWKSRSN
jgi:hypothetical protein